MYNYYIDSYPIMILMQCFCFSVVAYSVALGLIMSVGRQVTGKLPTGKVTDPQLA